MIASTQSTNVLKKNNLRHDRSGPLDILKKHSGKRDMGLGIQNYNEHVVL